MPLVKKRIFLAAGATSDQVLAGTTYEYLDQNSVIRVAAAVDTAGTSATADTTMDFTVNMQNLAETHLCLPWSPANRSAPRRILTML